MKTINDIGQTLEGHESGAPRGLGYLQRLNLAGCDLKGQLSSAYAQAGGGLSLSAKVDFGPLLIPFVHFDFGVAVEGERTAHSVLVLQRMPHRVWLEDMERPPQPPQKNPQAPPPPFPNPDWTASRPLALAVLHGKTGRLKATVAASAWAGLGSLGDFDQTGVTFGVGAAALLGGSVTRIADVAPRHYLPTPSDSSLNDDVDDLFAAELKVNAAAWVLEVGGGVQDLKIFDVPRVPLASRAQWEAEELRHGVVETRVITALEAADALAIPVVDSAAVGQTGFAVINALRSAAKKAKAMFASKRLLTDDLVREIGDVGKELQRWIDYLSDPKKSAELGPRTRRKLRGIAQLRLKEANDFIEALERRKARKARLSTPATQPAPELISPRFHLDIMDVEAEAGISASAKAALGVEPLVSFRGRSAHIEAKAMVRSRRIAFRYQSFVPGSGRTLTCSQEAVINYNTRDAAVEADAGTIKKTEQEEQEEKGKKKRFLATMSYRAVMVQWFDDLQGNNHKAIPNGSGVSFGMSILKDSFDSYARECKQMKQAPSGKPLLADLSVPVKGLETVMTKQLRVNAEELRAFMRNAPSSDADVDSYVIESAFAFTAPVALTIEQGRPKALFELDAVKKLAGPKADRGTDLRLQVIRLRIRIRHDGDKSRNLIELGWNPEPFGEELSNPWGIGEEQEDPLMVIGIDANPAEGDSVLPNFLNSSSLAIQVGIKVQRVRRAGAEGAFDFYIHYYPSLYDRKKVGKERSKALEASHAREIADMLVPPVTLFNQ
jgi:hypothetical protein